MVPTYIVSSSLCVFEKAINVKKRLSINAELLHMFLSTIISLIGTDFYQFVLQMSAEMQAFIRTFVRIYVTT